MTNRFQLWPVYKIDSEIQRTKKELASLQKRKYDFALKDERINNLQKYIGNLEKEIKDRNDRKISFISITKENGINVVNLINKIEGEQDRIRILIETIESVENKKISRFINKILVRYLDELNNSKSEEVFEYIPEAVNPIYFARKREIDI